MQLGVYSLDYPALRGRTRIARRSTRGATNKTFWYCHGSVAAMTVPEVPDSIRDQVLAEAAAAHAQILADRTELARLGDAAHQRLTARKAQLLAELTALDATLAQLRQEDADNAAQERAAWRAQNQQAIYDA